MGLLLKGARVVDPSQALDGVCDVLIEGDRIVRVAEGISDKGHEVRDLSGKVLLPGLIDIHVHLREPGFEYKETIESGSRAAAHGGFTGIAPMPNTAPVCDTGSRVKYIVEKARAVAKVHIYPVGSLSKGLEGKALSEMGDMVANGVVAFSDDGRGVQSDSMMRRAMDYAKMFGKTVMSHCQREGLVGAGVVNEGKVSTRLGMAGWPAQGEEIQIVRDIMLCELTGCALHIQHLTTAGGVELVRAAKTKGLPVTAEVTPHHLFLSEDDLDVTYDTNLKMNPPLRTKEDRAALVEGLLDGTIDCIATDHAPHAQHEKALEFELAPFGTTGLETALPLVLTNLVQTGKMDYQNLVEVMAIRPRKILGLEQVRIEAGSSADITVVDERAEIEIVPAYFESKAQNSAFKGLTLKGRAYDVYVDGKAVLLQGEVV